MFLQCVLVCVGVVRVLLQNLDFVAVLYLSVLIIIIHVTILYSYYYYYAIIKWDRFCEKGPNAYIITFPVRAIEM